MRSNKVTLGDLLGEAAGSYRALAVRDVVLNSRQVTPGSVFVALAGTAAHGLDHAADAVARGASAVLYEPHDQTPALSVPAIAVPDLRARLADLARSCYPDASKVALTGVTGTNGKTTVAYLIAQAMNHFGRRDRCGYIGTLGYGLPPQLREHELTTPDCLTLHRELAALAAPHAALEVSSHALAQDRVAGLAFAVAVFTNLTRDHLDAHGDFDAYGQAKARLFERPGIEHAVLNLNDAFSIRLHGQLPPGTDAIGVAVEGRPLAADIGRRLSGRVVASDMHGMTVDVRWQREHARLTSSLIGGFNAENLLSALAALLAWGKPLAQACSALATASAPPGRMETFGAGPQQPVAVVDFAHTPDALERVLTSLRGMTRRRMVCVFGCGGERDPGKRPLMGAIASRLADHVVLTDDNPRGEDPDAIIAAIRSGMPADVNVSIERDRAAAIATAIAGARPGDTVLIAGKGHERTQVAGGVVRAFSDRDVVGTVLAAREGAR